MEASLHLPGIYKKKTSKKRWLKPFSPAVLKSEETYIKRLASYQITAFIILSICSVLNLVTSLYTSFAVTAACACIIVAAWYLLQRGKKEISYIILLIAINATLSSLTYFEGYRSGSSLFFFTSTLSFIFLINGISKKLTIVTLCICFVSYFITFLVSGENSASHEVTSDNYQVNFAINLFLSFTSTVGMAYYLAKDNRDKQNSLKNQQVFLDTIFNTSMSAEIIMDMKSNIIINSNTRSQDIFRCTDTHCINGDTAFNLFEETRNQASWEVLKEQSSLNQTWEGELTCFRKDNSIFPGDVTIVEFAYNNKQYKKITVTDISEKKLMLRELQLAKQKAEESVEVKSRFLSQMSHELRTPLNGIIGTANLLIEEDALPQQKEHLDILKFSSEHMLRLVNEVLDLSKLDAQKITMEKMVVDFRQFIHNISSSFKSQCQDKGLTFSISIDKEVKNHLYTDPTRLNQVLTNLISNAIKFTPTGSVSLIINAKSSNKNYQTLEFSIADTGIGISKNKQKFIFEPFTQADIKTTRKYGGTGLGLNISNEIVKLMGGEILVESTDNKGSRFYFTLKMSIHHFSQPAISVMEDKAEKKQFTNIRLIIAEDNEINMKVATRFLDKWGVQYEKAVNGKEAVEIFLGKGVFNLLLMDLEMPEMDGHQALQEIRKYDSTVPVIAFTAAVFHDMQDKLKQNGFNDYIQKPFSPAEFYKKLEKIEAAALAQS